MVRLPNRTSLGLQLFPVETVPRRRHSGLGIAMCHHQGVSVGPALLPHLVDGAFYWQEARTSHRG